ncbi:hypothetical protein CA233_00535 [Sphingomonas sp. ABOLD]|uniref:Type II secretion system protein N n=1 Tax=Sphingomonas trueperi TaxID=53317 RepID=A0A7X6BCL0_9SPHN|nr:MULTISPECIES: type II secretion system protein N [Sphingomonas]NJB97698.1 hypothetical protein [Sphingomonas trueperi]RSV43494.1 hypothetical protein CA234_04630 [Sphingomonas sp. ABOLE]RSV52897.1 hypothetical protein CA233_00535 [Sphingomonas sp. ABOLD]
MLATAPASLLVRNVPWRSGVAGTIWNGEVGVAGGSKLEWQLAPLRSLTSLGLAADWKASGPDTDLGGRALVHLGGRTVLDHVSGAADASLLQAIQPDLPFTCKLVMQVEMARIAVRGGSQMMDGKVTTDPGSCRPKSGGGSTAVPALLLTAEHVGPRTTIRLTPATQRRQLLLDAVLGEDGMLDLGMSKDGAAALPFVGLPGGSRIQGKM